MRFFKSFTLLHRRTKSDPTPVVLAHSSPLRTTNSSSVLYHPLSSTTYPPPCQSYAANVRIFDLQVENTYLRHTLSVSSDELLRVKSQLITARDELFIELHRSMRQANENQIEIQRLRRTLMKYEKSSLLMPPFHSPFGDSPRVIQESYDSDSVDAAAVLGASLASVTPSVIGPRTQDEYISALKLTLTARKQLRECKKVAKFWKTTAQEYGKHQDVVTPSSSNISSIYEALSTDRQNAVESLISQRREVTPRQRVLEHQVAPAMEVQPSISDLLIMPVAEPAVHSIPCQTTSALSPLASQTFRQQINNVSSRKVLKRRSSAPKIARKVLRPLDLNVVTTSLSVASQTGSYRPSQVYPQNAHLQQTPGPQVCPFVLLNRAHMQDATQISTVRDDPGNPTPYTAPVSYRCSNCHPKNSPRYSSTVRRCLACTSNDSVSVDRNSTDGCDVNEGSRFKLVCKAPDASCYDLQNFSLKSTTHVKKYLAGDVEPSSKLPLSVAQSRKRFSFTSPFASPPSVKTGITIFAATSKCASKKPPSPSRLPVRTNVIRSVKLFS